MWEVDDVSPPVDSSDRLDSWKEIAAHLKRHVRTVQRWAKDENLPVHRHPHKKLGSVYGYKSELDAWWQNAQAALMEKALQEDQVAPLETDDAEPRNEEESRRPAGLMMALAAGLTAVAILGLVLVLVLSRPAPVSVASISLITRDLFWKSSMASDGMRAYYTQWISGRAALMSIPLAGAGLPTELPVALDSYKVLAVSHSGTQVLLAQSRFGEPGQAMVRSFSDRGLHKLVGVAASCAAWSPDDEWIAFCNGKHVFRIKDGGKPEKLAAFRGVPISIAWSPDGKLLRVLQTTAPPPAPSRRDADSVWLSQLDPASGSVASIELPEGARNDCTGSIAWIDGSFAFASQCLDSSNLWVMSETRSLFRKKGWSKLGIGFGRIMQIAPAGEDQELLLLAEESGPVQLARYEGATRMTAVEVGQNAVELDYSRDGHWVTFVEYPQRTLWLSRAGGTERRQLTFPPLRAQLPHFSPDGKTIAFSGRMPGTSWQVHLIGVDGQGLRKPASGVSDQGSPTWSPDGKELVFGDIEADQPDSHFIRRVDLHSGKMTNVPGSAGLRTARWSPDGRFIAAIRYPRQELLLFDVATSKWKPVAAGVAGDTLNWSADSRFLYFNFPFDPHSGIYRHDLKKSSTEPALRYTFFRKTPDVMGDTSGFSIAPDGSIILSGSMQSSRIYKVRLSGE